MITFLFWNIADNSNVLPHLSCLAQAYNLHTILLAECPNNLGQTINSLNSLSLGLYREEANVNAKVRAITRLGRNEFVHQYTSLGREMGVWKLEAPTLRQGEVLIAGIHLPAKSGGNAEVDQASVAGEVIQELYEVEDRSHHRNTILVGDFNMEPFDPGMTMVTGVHGLMTKRLASLRDRIHRTKPRRRFYNPMWQFFGDVTPGPPGSYVWKSSVLHNRHWGILDQVLPRASLINYLRDLEILESDGTHKFVTKNGAPDKIGLSDHLPIFFGLDI